MNFEAKLINEFKFIYFVLLMTISYKHINIVYVTINVNQRINK